MRRSTRLFIAFAAETLLATGCGGRLVAPEVAAQISAQNQLRVQRAFASRGLEMLTGTDDYTTETAPGPVIVEESPVGRAIVTDARHDVVVAVDREGVLHEVTLVLRHDEHVRERTGHCAPGSTGGGHHEAGPMRDPNAPPPPSGTVRRLYALRPEQRLGPPLQLTAVTVEIEPVYITGHLCLEIP